MAAAAAPEGASFPESKNWAPWARSIKLQEKFEAFSGAFSTLFPVWTLAVALVGLYRPAVMASIPTSAFTGLLGLLMLSMGITLTVDDFKRVLTKPGIMVLGFVGCYGLMPLLALGLSQAFGLGAADGGDGARRLDQRRPGLQPVHVHRARRRRALRADDDR